MPDLNLKIRDLKNNQQHGFPYQKLDQKDIEGETKTNSRQEFTRDVLIGLSQSPKKLSSKYFYNARGSQIFQKIMKLEEYYLTKAEYNILDQHGLDIIQPIIRDNKMRSQQDGTNKINLVELGAGDGYKTSLVLREFCNQIVPFEYIPIDISKGAMVSLMRRLEKNFDNINSEGIISDYLEGIHWLNQNKANFNFVLFLGANIGNFDRPTAISFLLKLWEVLNHDDYILIGFDLKKDIRLMQRAYNDKEGVTKDFNINLLRRINQELKANFNLDNFQHYATYNPVLGAMESFLISLSDQDVRIEDLNKTFSFSEKEPIHTEYSFKHTLKEIEFLAVKTGFKRIKNFYDKDHYFVDSLWQVSKR